MPAPTKSSSEWRTFILNLGYAITSLAWGCFDISLEKNQYLAVGLNKRVASSPSTEKLENTRTLEAYQLFNCHRVGQSYAGTEGTVVILKLSFDGGEYKDSPSFYGSLAVPGTPLSIKWMPKFLLSIKNALIAVLSSDGAIYIFEVHAPSTVAVKHSMKISPSAQVILSCFDWLNDATCSFLVAGD